MLTLKDIVLLHHQKTTETMVQSMTGYGKSQGEYQGKTITVEIRTLNSKQTDINLRTPSLYREKELEVRNTISEQLVRGKIDCSLYYETEEDDRLPVINAAVVRNYFSQLKKIAGEFYIEQDEQLLPIVMRLPEVLKSERQDLDEAEWEQVSLTLRSALEEVRTYRKQEGESIDRDLRARIDEINRLLAEVEVLEPERREKLRSRIRNNSEEFLNELKIDENRFEQEILYYLEKMDFSEEKNRLKHHCQFFIDTMDTEETAGKKLVFISQEIGREINTLGSKANDAAIQKKVVLMKDELEKIKEQLANIL